MRYLVVALTAFGASALTFFSGFGLGTILLPVFALFVPSEVAVGAVAIVHLANNALKLALLRPHVEWRVAARFGIPAVVFAPLGAMALNVLAGAKPLATYTVGGERFAIHPVNLALAALLAVAGAVDVIPRLSGRGFSGRYLVPGGAVTGFVGGLSGLQGALRSAFLIRLRLPKEAFIVTGVALAVLVDVSRVGTYAAQGTLDGSSRQWRLIAVGCAAAFVGTMIGNRALRKLTVRAVQVTVGVLLIAVAIALGAGLL